MIAKKIEAYLSSRNLDLSLDKVHYSPGKVPFSVGNLDPSSRTIYCFSKKVVFFTMELLLLHGEYVWD
jgi:hypothetical protein